METGITIKIWKVDYSFIINNYLNPELWEKTWTLFEYKNFKVTMNIYSILAKNQKIGLDIRCHDKYDYKEETIWFSLKIDDLDFLKRQINSAIYNLMVKLEIGSLSSNDEFNELMERKQAERETLSYIAEEFLDKCDITNDNLRCAYTDAYIDEYAKIPDIIQSFVNSKIYTITPDLYITFLNSLENDPKTNIRLKEIEEKLGSDDYQKVLEKIQTFDKEFKTDEYFDEMKSNLEEV